MADTDKDQALLERVRSATHQKDAAELEWKAAIIAAAGGGWSQEAIGDAAKISRQRAQQIIKATPPTGQLLLAPDAGKPAVICVIEKIEADRGRPSITKTTIEATYRLIDLAGEYGLDIRRETVPVGGVVLDLNRPNLIVLLGPRSSPLLAQAISADPVIKWRPDQHGDWYIINTSTGTEYHSEFDRSTDPGLPWPRTCYAHIGRIRRPDDGGSWMCLAGAHAPGIAGATDYLCREIESLWDKAKISLWSAIVQVTADKDGTVKKTSLITPVYVHGRR